jgi:L-lysine 6-transaminase
VENALKAAFDWKVQKNLRKGKGELGKKVLHFRQAFHGRGGYTVSITNTADPKKYMYYPLWTNWPRVSNPYATFPLEGKNLQDTIERERVSLAVSNYVLFYLNLILFVLYLIFLFVPLF